MDVCTSTLPASWYTSNDLYTLERRAVFYKSWTLLGPVTKWPNAGEDYPNEIAQVHFIVRRASADWRSLKVFSLNGLEMRSHLSPTGLLFLALSDEAVSFEEFFPGLEELIAKADFTQYLLRRPLKYTTKANWKTMVDGYQECLHCAYAHPAFAKVYSPVSYKVVNHKNYSQHFTCSENPLDGLFIYMFPNATLSLYAGGVTSWRIMPQEDASSSVMEFDYYHEAEAGSKEFEDYFKFTRTVALEDLELAERAQINLNIGIYTEGLLNPNKENGVSYYQTQVLDMCSAQYEKEQEQDTSSSAQRPFTPKIAQMTDPTCA
ncbi:unnamed protein product [Clonostachys rosea]|uniref:Choline monooxygenase, chloroplastic n=1 Tax=Bionectria ochroleuca TaxID=29856 RepID=A0ABY6UV92_BIOOC|nr:unnamed protein product [Clonostachys rosea]